MGRRLVAFSERLWRFVLSQVRSFACARDRDLGHPFLVEGTASSQPAQAGLLDQHLLGGVDLGVDPFEVQFQGLHCGLLAGLRSKV